MPYHLRDQGYALLFEMVSHIYDYSKIPLIISVVSHLSANIVNFNNSAFKIFVNFKKDVIYEAI